MRDKVVFFILGAVLATCAYFLGNMNLTAEDEVDVTRFEDILAGTITVDNIVVKDTIVSKGTCQVYDTLLVGRKDRDGGIVLFTDETGKAVIGVHSPNLPNPVSDMSFIIDSLGVNVFIKAAGRERLYSFPRDFDLLPVPAISK